MRPVCVSPPLKRFRNRCKQGTAKQKAEVRGWNESHAGQEVKFLSSCLQIPGRLTILKPLGNEGIKWVPPLRLYMAQDEYTITFIGPEGATDLVAHDHEDAMSIISDLTKASNGYHSVKIEPPIQ